MQAWTELPNHWNWWLQGSPKVRAFRLPGLHCRHFLQIGCGWVMSLATDQALGTFRHKSARPPPSFTDRCCFCFLNLLKICISSPQLPPATPCDLHPIWPSPPHVLLFGVRAVSFSSDRNLHAGSCSPGCLTHIIFTTMAKSQKQCFCCYY